MTRVSDRFLQLAVLAALTGMGLGIGMAVTQNFQLQSVHAHVNLLGWVSMMLYGLFYRAVPKAAEGRLPAVHFWLNAVGFVAMAALLTQDPQFFLLDEPSNHLDPQQQRQMRVPADQQ